MSPQCDYILLLLLMFNKNDGTQTEFCKGLPQRLHNFQFQQQTNKLALIARIKV